MYCVLESVFRLCCVSSAVWIFFFRSGNPNNFYFVGPSPIICCICDKKFNKMEYENGVCARYLLVRVRYKVFGMIFENNGKIHTPVVVVE